jgi:hypothetical protein
LTGGGERAHDMMEPAVRVAHFDLEPRVRADDCRRITEDDPRDPGSGSELERLGDSVGDRRPRIRRRRGAALDMIEELGLDVLGDGGENGPLVGKVMIERAGRRLRALRDFGQRGVGETPFDERCARGR